MSRDELIEAGVRAIHVSHAGTTTKLTEVILDAVEPLIRAEARAEALEFCCDDRDAELRAQIEAHFRENLPPYLFSSTKNHVFPGMEAITLHEAIMDVWHEAERQILELVDGRQ